ncbi:MAG: type IX secretion system protein PorQ [Rhodothermales bacterium]
MRLLILFLFLFVVPQAARAQVESSAYPVVQLDASARSAALGGNAPALVDVGPGSIFSNPALVTPDMHGAAELSYLNHVSDLSAGWLSYARNVEGIGTAAVGLRYLSFGEMDRLDASGNADGTFGASDLGLTVALSRPLALVGAPWMSRIRYGGALSWLNQRIDTEGAQALTMDLGAVYHDAERRFTAGMVVQHLGLRLSSLGSRADRLPTDVRVGLAKRLNHLPVLFSVTAYRLHALDGGPDGASVLAHALYHAVLAAEFQFSESFRLRFGYNHRRHDELKVKARLDFAGVSTGVGIKIRNVGVDYAYNSWSSLGGLHRISVKTALF